MEYVFIALIIAAVFGLCWLIDKGFTGLFRSQAQHMSGLSVRLNRRYGSIGLILFVVGLGALFTGLSDSTVLLVGGTVVTLLGIGLVVYYMTFGIFYDDEGFILTTFGHKSRLYHYRDIRHQQLYIVTGGNILVELHLSDGRAVQLHNHMTDTEKFLNHAFRCWCTQTGRDPENCDFHDPSNSLWFPREDT